jgi:hypothetical protein
MSAVSSIFLALALVFGGGYALDRIYGAVKIASVERVHRGMPHLSVFTSRLTCSHISRNGTLVPTKCGSRRMSR